MLTLPLMLPLVLQFHVQNEPFPNVASKHGFVDTGEQPWHQARTFKVPILHLLPYLSHHVAPQRKATARSEFEDMPYDLHRDRILACWASGYLLLLIAIAATNSYSYY